jgi:hypothetical protein
MYQEYGKEQAIELCAMKLNLPTTSILIIYIYELLLGTWYVS